ncbi:MAG: glycosyltransferase family 4 protein [Bacteroidetes bacterium]|nr:glycosyltransferase family 4 protein [Bacteroidota bacterium]
MNILYDYQTFALQSRGGISRYFSEIIPRIASVCDVDAFMGFHINEYGLEQSRKSFRRFFGIKVPELSHTLGLRLKMNEIFFPKFAKKIGSGIYHQTYFYNPLEEWRGKRVVTVYDMIYELFPHEYDADDPTARNKAVAVAKADWVICISEHTKKDVVRLLHVPEERTSVVHLANSLTISADSARLVGSPYLLYVGKRGGYKNFKMLLLAFAHASSLHKQFKLVCFGGGAFSKEERELMVSLGVTARVESRDGNDDALANLYMHASAFVYPSLCEGFGIPPLEAMQYGCPVVVSNASSIPEVVRDAGIYFDPMAEDDIAAKIESVVSDTALRSTILSRGKERVRQFSWEKCATETLKVYERLQ